MPEIVFLEYVDVGSPDDFTVVNAGSKPEALQDNSDASYMLSTNNNSQQMIVQDAYMIPDNAIIKKIVLHTRTIRDAAINNNYRPDLEFEDGTVTGASIPGGIAARYMYQEFSNGPNGRGLRVSDLKGAGKIKVLFTSLSATQEVRFLRANVRVDYELPVGGWVTQAKPDPRPQLLKEAKDRLTSAMEYR